MRSFRLPRPSFVWGLVLLSVMAIGLMASLSGVVGFAFFSDVATNTTNTFSTGTLDISTSPSSAFISYADMAPGDGVVAGLTVQNGGSLDLRYAITSEATNPDGKGLRTQLDLTVWDEASEGDAGQTCASSPPGVVLYGPDSLAGATEAAIVGDISQGEQPGDRDLAAGASEVLCFLVELPLSTGNAYQNASTSATFRFYAEQTANNP